MVKQRAVIKIKFIPLYMEVIFLKEGRAGDIKK
jgi:hypothetical protein